MTASLGERFISSIYLLLCSCYVVSTDSTVLLEAEKGMTTGELKYRDSASNRESICLTHGEYVSNSFTTKTKCSIVVLNVRYSEGSAADTATVSVDGQDVGTFRTTASSNSGDPWNDFHNSGQVGGDTFLAAGEHTVMITVSTTDEYGMEVDYTQVRTTYENTTSTKEDPTQEGTAIQDSKSTNTTEPSEEPDDTKHTSLTTGEIVIILVVTLVAFTTLVTVPAVALYVRWKKCHSRRYEEIVECVQNPSKPNPGASSEVPQNMRP